ncbi:uncharacterized protein LOC129343795 [Eublepharis macularius]|uniref:Uncharacterized protein LOC129331716 n=2 Tax=Eublepharis macularius TaxID=481883 RepID=A0AA97KHF8_EUBMA|nr:uncharacterized protein LOC129331716 [Eublepharis macularius]XP_054842140.1 uncharacterized protein LOC129334233 isoform X1 [Eublepharis macularius]XP_054856125.1 uncharacterized protein LOC129343795 [Eublepharis macularius]
MAALKPTSGRGVSWREKETLDLIEFWGEEKVQEALLLCHRNIDVFERISEQMVARGHARTALECRTKTKALRQEYKRVAAHNGRSGNAPATCPFYAQLARIFRGDASIRPQRVARSLNLQSVSNADPMGEDRSNHGVPAPWEGSEELFTHPMVTLHLQAVPASTPNYSGSSTEQETSIGEAPPMDMTDPEDENAADDPDLTQIEEFPEVTGQGAEDPQGDLNNPPAVEQPQVPTAQLSPATRLEKARTRTRRVSVLTNVAERMLSQAQREEQNNRKERGEILEATSHWRAAMESETRWHEDIIREAREDRRAFIEAQSQNMEGLNRAVGALSSLTELFVREQRAGPVAETSQNANSKTRDNDHEKAPLRKRARIIKKRERYDPSL